MHINDLNEASHQLKCSSEAINAGLVTDEARRSYFGINTIFTSNDWSYYYLTDTNGEPKRCQTFGKSKSYDGFPNGISFWSPHCVPSFLADEANKTNSNPTIKCAKSDREYVALINNVSITFTHYLLTPNENLTENEVIDAFKKIQYQDCTLLECGGSITDHNNFDMDSLDVAAGAEFAAQQLLKTFAEDSNNEFSDRVDSVLLYAWLGSFDGSIDDLYSLKPWAANFILEAMNKYGPLFAKDDSNLLLNYSAAYDSLSFQSGGVGVGWCNSYIG